MLASSCLCELHRKLVVIKFSHKILATVKLNLNFTHACTLSMCAKF